MTNIPINTESLPPGWQWAKLGEVLAIIQSGTRPKGGISEIKEGIPSIGAEHLNALGTLDLVNLRFVPKEFYETMSRGKIQRGDVLVVKDGATTGRVALVRNDFPYEHAAINEHVFRLRVKEFLEQEILFWFLYSSFGQTQIHREFHGAAQGGINQQFANGVNILVPPLDEQKRIAEKLQDLMADIDHARSACKKQLDTAKSLTSAFLRQIFESEQAKSWPRKKLGEVCEINPSRPRGFSRAPDAATTFVPMACVDEKLGVIFKPKVVSYQQVARGYTYFEENDVLFAKITPCMQNGKHAIARSLIDGIGFGTTEFHVLRPKAEASAEWIHYFIRRRYFLEEATGYFTGAVGQQRVPEEFLTRYPIPLPPLDEQKRISTQVNEQISKAEKVEQEIEKQLETINALPQAILRKAFRGEI